MNAKVQRPSVCNAAETLLIDRSIADKFVPVIFDKLRAAGVELRADEAAKAISPEGVKDAAEDDWYTCLLYTARCV